MSPPARIGRRGRAALLVAVGAVAGGAAYAVADVPDNSGVIHGCVSRSDQPPAPINGQPQDLRVIDPSARQSCDTGGSFIGFYEEPLDWNFKGPIGPRGQNGVVDNRIVTVSPPVKTNDAPVGQVALGSGKQKLTFQILSTGFSTSHGNGSGAGAGKVKFNEFHVTKTHDNASPVLFRALTSGKHFPGAIIVVRRKAGKGQHEYLVIKLQDVVVTSVQTGSASSGGKPQENLTLNFTKVKFEYKPQKSD